jgi:C-1 hydroxylase
MSVEENKTLIRRYVEAWNRGDLQALSEFWSRELVHHTRSNTHGYEDTKRIVAAFMSQFPDMRFRLDDIIAEEDKVVSRMTWSATHKPDHPEGPTTGVPITCTVIGIARLAGGRIAEHWGVTDELSMMAQMGLLPEEFLTAMA